MNAHAFGPGYWNFVLGNWGPLRRPPPPNPTRVAEQSPGLPISRGLPWVQSKPPAIISRKARRARRASASTAITFLSHRTFRCGRSPLTRVTPGSNPYAVFRSESEVLERNISRNCSRSHQFRIGNAPFTVVFSSFVICPKQRIITARQG